MKEKSHHSPEAPTHRSSLGRSSQLVPLLEPDVQLELPGSRGNLARQSALDELEVWHAVEDLGDAGDIST